MQIQRVPQSSPQRLPEGQTREWGILVYNVGESDEGLMSTHNLLDLQKVGSDENTHVICHNYRSPWIYERFLGKGQDHLGSREYYLTQDSQDHRRPRWLPSEVGHFAGFLRSVPERISSPELPVSGGKVHEAAQLKRFLLDNMRRFPARHFALIMSGHGCGFAGQAVTAQGRMSNEELAQVLREVAHETGQKMDVLNLNTCYSAGLEVAAPLLGGARVMVGSQSTVCAANQSMAGVLQALQGSLKAGESVSAEDLGRLFVEESRHQPLSNLYTPTLSAVDVDRAAALAEDVGELHRLLLDRKVDPALLRGVLKDSLKLDYASVPRAVQVMDLGSFLTTLGQRCPDALVRQQCKTMLDTLKQAVLGEQHQAPERESATTRLLRPFLGKDYEDLSGCTGLTIYYEEQPDRPGHRLAQVENTPLGKKWQIRRLVDYIQEGQSRPEPGRLEKMGEKVRQWELKAHKAVGVPYVVPLAKRCLKVAAFLGAGAALHHLGVPVSEAILGPYFAGSGAWAAGQQLWQGGKVLAQKEPLSLEQREKVIDAAASATLGLTMGTFGLHMMGVLPASVVWPLVGIATAAKVGRFAAKVASHGSAVEATRQEAREFSQASTVGQKLSNLSRAQLRPGT